jgi:hypothetical protein
MKEPEDLTYRLTTREAECSLGESEVEMSKKLFQFFKDVVEETFAEGLCQVIPVGSFIISCMTIHNPTVDCFIHFDKSIQIDAEEEMSKFCLQIEYAIKGKVSQDDFEVVREGTDVVVFKDLRSQVKVRATLYKSDEDGPFNRSSASVLHSNWMINQWNQSQQAWQAVKFFRLIRIWRYECMLIKGCKEVQLSSN